MSYELGEELDGARLVRFDETLGLVGAWFGGRSTQVHLYNTDGRAVLAKTMAPDVVERGAATVGEAEDAIEAALDQIRSEVEVPRQ